MLHAFGKWLFKIIFTYFLPAQIRGTENVPKKGGFIIAGNHASFLDPIVFGTACPRTLNYMARDTLFKRPVFGWILRHVNAFPLKRNAADIGAIKEALKRLKENQGLLLFPEGERRSDGKIGEGLEGVGFLARKSGVPVVPAYVEGTETVLPKGAKFIRRGRIKVVFGEPVTFQSDCPISDKDISQLVMEHIARLKG
jgi:1-acyl-sn-glycerol-3-phosphate acyltransferase